jgi:hypothetical protein
MKNNPIKTRINISKLMQIGLLLTLFLPFFPKGCEQKNAQAAPKPNSSIVTVDTLEKVSSELINKNGQSDTLKTAKFKNGTINKAQVLNEDDEWSATLSSKSKILKMLLRPNDDYTGVANIIDSFSLLKLGSGLVFAFILWIIALIVKIKDYNNIFNLINIIGLLLLFGSHSIYNAMSDIRLWGFWVCFIWGAAMIIYDTIILLKIRKNGGKTSV